MAELVRIITAADPVLRDQSLDSICARFTLDELLAECAELDAFRRRSENLYERVRALFFLYAIHRFHLPQQITHPSSRPPSAVLLRKMGITHHASIPFKGYEHLLQRRFEEAIDSFLAVQSREGPSDAISSALAAAYHRLGFQTLANQVRRSVRSVRGNQWMFRMGHPADHPLRIRPELLQRNPADGTYPILRECTPVRMDLTHCGWSDIFFLGMDFPEGAKVLNISIDLAVHGRDAAPRPPVEAYLRVIDEPLLRLASVDLGASADITNLADVFDFAKDYLGLLKAAVIASGIVPPGIEGSGQSLAELLARIVGPGRGLEIVSNVNNIPKGSRLAVSTNLLAALISVCMRATGQTRGEDGGTDLQDNEAGSSYGRSGAGVPPAEVPTAVPAVESKAAHTTESPATGTVASTIAGGTPAPLPFQIPGLTGTLSESERRLVLARAILGEWLGGSGGGWQDSGGVWPGMKLIEGVLADEGDPEFAISRGRLMPQHRILDSADAPSETRRKLQDSLVLVHGGMAQNVGPILEMVTEKYLLRSAAEWTARQSTLGILNEILGALRTGDVRAIGAATTKNFFQPIQTIIPWATNYFTETLITRVRAEFGDAFWGFWMLGGMSGGGMGFIFAPEKKAAAQQRLQEIMSGARRELDHALPFAMEPVVYDFAINERGTFAEFLEGDSALMPAGYYALVLPALLRLERQTLPVQRRTELDKFGAACRTRPELRDMVQTLFDTLLPRGKAESQGESDLATLLAQNGFDRAQHEQIRAELKEGRIGLAQNRLPASAVIEDVNANDVLDATGLTNGSGAAGPTAGSGAAVLAATVPTGVPPVGSSKTSAPTAGTAVGTMAGGTPAPLSLPFTRFDNKRPATIRQRRLPHWSQEGATYFITFRLADSLPESVLQQHLRERDDWLRQHRKGLTPERNAELRWFFREKLEDELDKGLGTCVLKDAIPGEIVEGALRHFDEQRYVLGSYVIMPNHVHVLVRPIMEHTLSGILHSWKSFSAHEINKRTKHKGQLWLDESFDHIVRDEHELERFERYIHDNPVRARLKAGSFRFGIGSGAGCGADSGAAVPAATVPTGVPPVGSSKTSAPTAGTAVGTMAGGTPAPLSAAHETGMAALRRGEVAVVTLAAGAGSRWTQGAGVVKALHPFCKLNGRHRTFIETHLAKSRRVSREAGAAVPHIFTTGYLTHEPISEFLKGRSNYHYEGTLLLSPGKAVGLRMIPTVRDLRFLWEEMPQQLLDEQQQKVRDSLRHALINWARAAGEASDYTDNVPLQCLHPVGHWYEVPNLFRNGVLAQLLAERPQLKYLLLHNVDTMGADVDPALLGLHIESGACLTFEVITRRIEDRGGGLARVNGRVRLVEGLAIPREETEFELSYYNSNTCWIDLDKLLAAFEISRDDIVSAGAVDPDAAALEKINNAIRAMAAKMPTYVTLKEVKKRWGRGQEDVFPVTQFEKLWVDMTGLPEIESRFVVVPRWRGQQLKDQAQLDGWLRDGSAAYVESLCEWAEG